MTNLTESKPTRLEIRPSIVTWNERERITSPDRSWIWIAAFTVLYFPLTILRAAARPMWFDELFTFYISRMSLGNIWTILSSGIEPNPPLSYWLTHFSMGLFGKNEIAVRLPAIAGYWLMSICLFFFVRRYG